VEARAAIQVSSRFSGLASRKLGSRIASTELCSEPSLILPSYTDRRHGFLAEHR
jgi:hypothetical protein